MNETDYQKIEELKHTMFRLRTYQTDSILRMKIAVDTLKEMDEMLENIILETQDDQT